MNDVTSFSCECHLRDSSLFWRLWTDWPLWVAHAPQSLGKEDGEAEKKKVDIVCFGAMPQAAGAQVEGVHEPVLWEQPQGAAC